MIYVVAIPVGERAKMRLALSRSQQMERRKVAEVDVFQRKLPSAEGEEFAILEDTEPCHSDAVYSSDAHFRNH